MNRFTCLILITFIESVSLAMAGIGVYFYTHEILQFSDGQNLVLALCNGGTYVATALVSHRVSARLGEKRALTAALVVQVLGHGLMWCFAASGWAVVTGSIAFSLCGGLKWPVIESYVSAGRTPDETARALGRFNVAWSLATPLGIIAAGPVIASGAPALLFAAVLVLDVLSLLLIWPLERVPQHLAHDHPQRPGAQRLSRWEALLASSRWSMITCYGVLYMLNALLPGIFDRLGFAIAAATGLAAVIHLARLAAFLVMRYRTGWHGWLGLHVLIILGVPLGFALIVSEQWLVVVLAGELILGVVSGMSYYAALYYAMVIENAAVDAGSGHETSIGLGLTGGPAVGLVGAKMAAVTGSQALGMLLGVGPFLVVASFISAWPLRKARRGRHDPEADNAGE